MQAGLVSNNVGPYTGVELDVPTVFDTPTGPRKFRLITYQAFNAMGLIGSECNGVAILDEDNMAVVCDEIEKQSSGWCGASVAQKNKLQELCKMSWTEFQEFVNNHSRTRNDI